MPLKRVPVRDDLPSRQISIEAIAGSATFQRAPALRALLEYLWIERDNELSEYAIAVGALGRKADFDAKYDSTVRVQISRLRQKLKDYYDTEGRTELVVLEIPLGGHTVQICERDVPPAVLHVAEPSPIPGTSRAVWWLGGLCIVLAAACAYLVIDRRLVATPAATADAVPTFWSNFLANRKPVTVYLPTPAFFEWPSRDLKVRDIHVNSPEWEQSAEISRLAELWGSPRMMPNYTVVYDAMAAVRLAQFFQTRGVPSSAATTLDMSVDTVGQHNTVFLGTPSISSPRLKGLFDDMNFVFNKTYHGVLNRHPLPGEAPEYKDRIISQTQTVELGIIAHLGGGTSGNLLMLTSGHSATLVSQLLTPASAGAFERAWKKAGSPFGFEALVEAEVENGRPLRTRVLAVRESTIKDWQARLAAR